MSLDLFQTDNRDAVNNAERTSAPLLPAGFKESFDTAWDNAVLFGQSFAFVNARNRAMDNIFQQAYDTTQDERFRQDTVQFSNRFRNAAGGHSRKTKLEVYNEIAAEHASEGPEREATGFAPSSVRPITPEQLDVHAADLSKEAREAYKAMAARQGGGLGTFVGSAAGGMADPINVMTFPLAAPEALGIIKTGLTWAGIGAGTQTAIEAIGMPYRQRVEPGYLDSGEPATNVGEAAVFAGGLGATLKALGTGWRWYKNKGAAPRTIRDAGNVLDSEAQIAETNPLRGPEGETAHREALSKTFDDVVRGDAPNVDGIITPEMMDGYQSRLTPIMKARQAAIEASNQAALLAREDARLPGTMERLSEVQLGEIRGAVDALDTGLTERVGALTEGVTKAQVAVEKQTAIVEQLKTAAAAAPDDVKLSARFDKAQAKLDKLTEVSVKRAGELPLRQVTAEARAADRKGRATGEMTKAITRLAEDGYGLKLEPAEIATLADNILKAPADSVDAVLRDTTEHLVDKARAQRALAPPTPFGAARPHEEQAAHALRITNIMRMRVQTLAREVGYAMPKEEAGAIAARLLEVKEPDALAILDELVLRPRTLATTMAELPPVVPPGIPSPPPIVAYHGSPHPPFEAFDSTKIGTGEGAQSWGHGLYFAEHEAVSRSYQLMGDAKVGGRPFDVNNPVHKAVSLIDEFGSREAAITETKARLAHDPGSYYEDVLRNLESGKKLPALETTGQLYRVRINANREHFLDVDKPLSEQSEHVRNALLNHPDPSVAGTASKWGHDPKTMYDRLAQRAEGGRAEVSQMLRDAGIPGIKYLDQKSRGGVTGAKIDAAGLEGSIKTQEAHIVATKSLIEQSPDAAQKARFQASVDAAEAKILDMRQQIERAKSDAESGTRNFVVFDDKSIEITHRNGEPVTPKEKAAALAPQQPPKAGAPVPARPAPHPDAAEFGFAINPDKAAPDGPSVVSRTEFRPYGAEEVGQKTVSVNGEMVASADVIRGSDGNLQIQKIETLPAAQRKGYATQLVRDLQDEFPDAKITTSMRTDQGSAFFRALGSDRGSVPVPRERAPAEPLPPAYERALAEQHTPANVAKLRADPEMTATVARDLDRMRAETPDKEIPIGVDKDGAPITRTVEETATDIEQRKALADEVRASCGPQPEPDSGGQ